MARPTRKELEMMAEAERERAAAAEQRFSRLLDNYDAAIRDIRETTRANSERVLTAVDEAFIRIGSIITERLPLPVRKPAKKAAAKKPAKRSSKK